MTHDWDAIVIGAGPAGAFTALKLARAGARTLLVDRKAFPRQKPCGGCLNAESVGILEAAGLADALHAAGARPIAAIRLKSGARSAQLSLPGGLALSRGTLDDLIVRAAMEAGCEFLNATALVGSTTPDGRTVTLVRPDQPPVTASAKVIIAADGLGNSSSRNAHSITVDPAARVGIAAVASAACIAAPAGVITMAVGTGGYVGVVGVEGGRVNIAAALDPAFLKSHTSPARAVRAILGGAGIAASDELDSLDWLGTPPLTRRLERPVGERLFVLGDAAGYVEPFTGEGMAWALSSAAALTPLAMLAVARWDTAFEREWLGRYAALVTRRQRWCRLISRALRHPPLVNAAVATLSHWPSLARPFVARVAPSAPPVFSR